MDDSNTHDWIRATTFVAIGDGLLWNALSFGLTSPSLNQHSPNSCCNGRNVLP